MRGYKRLLIGGSVLLLVAAAIILLFDQPPRVSAGAVCNNGVCAITETLVNDFVRGQFNYTGIRNLGDGEIQLLPIGLTSQWYTDTYRLPGVRTELAAVIYHDPDYRETIYVIGGFDGESPRMPRSEIFTATTTITGAIASPGWFNAATMDFPFAATSAVISTTQNGGFLYVLGGYTLEGEEKVVTSTILYKALDVNGNLAGGAWSRASLPPSLPDSPVPLYWHQAFVHKGYLYVVAGADASGNPVSEIYRAPIQSGGGLGDWVSDTSSPITRASFGTAVWTSPSGTDVLYLIGGKQNKDDLVGQAEVDYTTFLTSFGADEISLTSPFTSNVVSGLLAPLYAHGVVQGNGVLYVTGGDQGAEVITTTVRVALIDSQSSPPGQLSIGWIPSNPLPQTRRFHATVMSSIGEVYVIGGFGGSPAAATDTVYHGSTSGMGQAYAPYGNYVSRILNLGGQREVTSLAVNTTLTSTNNMTMTLQYRIADSPSNLISAGWTTLGNAPVTTTLEVTTTYPMTNAIGSYIQYQALMTTTLSNLSPVMNAFQINYRVPPDLIVTNIQPINVRVGQPSTVRVSVKNQGGGPARPFNLPARLPSTDSRGGRTLRNPAAPSSSYYFWVDVYIDPNPAPTSRTDGGNCFESWQGVDPGQTVVVPVNGCVFSTLGVHTLYAQVDTCAPSDPDYSWCTVFGHIFESTETNNIYSKTVNLDLKYLFLPLIMKGQ